jgi:LssY C-terminus
VTSEALIASKAREDRVCGYGKTLMVGRIAVALLFWWGLRAGIPLHAAQAAGTNPPATSSPSENASQAHTLPSGTVLQLRLTTPVSTESSHLNEEVKAEVERAIVGPDGVEVPVGAVATGRIAKLIPSSTPTDRAKLLIGFDTLTLPGQSPAKLAAHVSGVDNARETLLADGTIVGVLQNELPVTLLNSAMAKIGKAKSSGAQASQNTNGSWLGSADTSIAYPAGAELSLTLDKPLTVTGIFQPEFAREIPNSLAEAIVHLLGQSPRRVASKKGNLGGVVNLVIIGNEAEIHNAFIKAGWAAAATEDANSLWSTFHAVINGKGYDAAPMSTLYLYGRPEDAAFEKMLNDFGKRHHLRLWRAPVNSPDGRSIWLVAADHDNGVDIHPGVISHATDPHVDEERAKVGADLGMTGFVAAEALVVPPNPLHSGYTATGGEWETDGKVLVIEMKPQSKASAT